jgi:hypothetical protein
MLWKSFAVSFSFERRRAIALKKYNHAQAGIFFNGANLPLASTPLYICLFCL